MFHRVTAAPPTLFFSSLLISQVFTHCMLPDQRRNNRACYQVSGAHEIMRICNHPLCIHSEITLLWYRISFSLCLHLYLSLLFSLSLSLCLCVSFSIFVSTPIYYAYSKIMFIHSF